MTKKIDNANVKTECPKCGRWMYYDDVTGTVNAHGWISLDRGGFTDCPGSKQKARTSSRAYYDKPSRRWVPVKWDRTAQEWRER